MASRGLGALGRGVLGVMVVIGSGEMAVGQSGDAVARTDARFADGRRLLAEGAVSEACSQFAASYQLAPRGGTLLNLALCHEQDGKLLLARGELKMALARARRDGRTDREPIAIEHIATVEAKLSWLHLLPPANLGKDQAIHLTIDGAPIDQAEWTAVPLEPGVHVIACAASGLQTRTLQINVGPTPERKTIQLEAPAPITASGLVPPVANVRATHVTQAAKEPSGSPLYKRRWFWGAVATAVAGAVAAAVIVTSRTEYPTSDVTTTYP